VAKVALPKIEPFGADELRAIMVERRCKASGRGAHMMRSDGLFRCHASPSAQPLECCIPPRFLRRVASVYSLGRPTLLDFLSSAVAPQDILTHTL
jgi:hypothetical protein